METAKNPKCINFNKVRDEIIRNDRRFSAQNGHLLFEGVDLTEIAKKYPSPCYVYSEPEIVRNLKEINYAFAKRNARMKCFFAAKTCSLMKILAVMKEAGVCVETNSRYEVQKALDAGFTGDQIVFNGVVKKPEDLELAIKNDLYLINVDSFYELDIIASIAKKLGKTANVCVRVEPNVPSPTHPNLVTAYHAKSGIDLQDAEKMFRRIAETSCIRVRGLHMHVGDQIPVDEPFRQATRILVEESARLEKTLGIKLELINVGGGIPTPYKYEKGDAAADYLYGGIGAEEFAEAVVSEVHKWRKDVEIVIEPGRKVVGSAAVLLSEISCEKTKTNYDANNNIEDIVEWKFLDVGFSNFIDPFYDWYHYVLNGSKVDVPYEQRVKIAGPLCDGGDYFKYGVDGEFFFFPANTRVGDTAVILDAGAYNTECMMTYNCRPRAAVVLIDKNGKVQLIRKEDTYEEMLGCEIY